MKDIYIIGASGFGREVAWLIEELDEFNVIGFVDDNKEIQDKKINDIPVVGGISFLIDQKEETNVVIAIGNPTIRYKIYEQLKENKIIVISHIKAYLFRFYRFMVLYHGVLVGFDCIE